MADYSEMRALDVWYDVIDIDRFVKSIDETTRKRVEQRLKTVRKKNTPEFLFPKFTHIKAPYL